MHVSHNLSSRQNTNMVSIECESRLANDKLVIFCFIFQENKLVWSPKKYLLSRLIVALASEMEIISSFPLLN